MSQTIRLRDTRTLPFFWISRTLLGTYRLSWRAILAYNALAYYAKSSSASCSIPIKNLAQTVNVSEDTMRRGLVELSTKKVIQTRARKKSGSAGAGASSLPNEYVLLDLKDEGDHPL